MTNIDVLRSLFTDAAAAAPSDTGLLAAVRHRSQRQRRQRLIVTAAVVLAIAAVAGISRLALASPATRTHQPIGPISSHRPSPNPKPLVPFQPPTFPYEPTWAPGSYAVSYDEDGVAAFGVTGIQLRFVPTSSNWPFTVVFVSADEPHISGAGTAAQVQNRLATVVEHTPIVNYKDEDTAGSVVYWQTKTGDWVTLGVVGGHSGAKAVQEADLLLPRRLPITTTFVPGLIPAGLHVKNSSAGAMTLVPDAADSNASVEIVLLGGEPPEPMGVYSPPASTDETWFTYPDNAGDYVRVVVYGPYPFDLGTFVAHLVVNSMETALLTP